jgi:hypothetical protein
VQKRLADAGIVASEGALGTSSRGKVLRVFVGAWPKLRGIRALRTLEQGPQASGVFARFSAGGARLDLLDQRGGVAQTAGPGAGLVAATKLGEDVTTVTWVVTGVDDPGTLAAANLLTEPALRDAFAVAAVPGGVRKLPFGQGGGG